MARWSNIAGSERKWWKSHGWIPLRCLNIGLFRTILVFWEGGTWEEPPLCWVESLAASLLQGTRLPCRPGFGLCFQGNCRHGGKHLPHSCKQLGRAWASARIWRPRPLFGTVVVSSYILLNEPVRMSWWSVAYAAMLHFHAGALRERFRMLSREAFCRWLAERKMLSDSRLLNSRLHWCSLLDGKSSEHKSQENAGNSGSRETVMLGSQISLIRLIGTSLA